MKKLSLEKTPAKSRLTKSRRKQRKRKQRKKNFLKLYYQQVIEGVARGGHGARNERIPFYKFRESLQTMPGVQFGELINFWKSQYALIRERAWVRSDQAVMRIPSVFSLSDEQHAPNSFHFIGQLFDCLYHEKAVHVVIDYQHCQRIDIDAQVYMDVMLREFIRYFKTCRRRGLKRYLKDIVPIHFGQEQIAKVLFSVGGMKLFNQFDVSFPDVIPLALQTGYRKHKRSSELRDLEITRVVEYVVESLRVMGKALTHTAETLLYKVVGETLINASEHATTNYRYVVGYFQKQAHDEDVLGTLQLVIMNFGDTIYQKFKDPRCPNQDVVRQMEALSEAFTQKRFFRAAQFEEETLWTLYALQESVTSKRARRGNGTIRFIQGFFGLKGDMACDNESRMTLLSGQTRIIFDGSYQIDSQGAHKIIPFNGTGSLQDKPDGNFVKFVPDYFPGVMLSARICIKPENTAPLE